MKNVMKEAHEMTKRIIKKGDSYKATFRLCLIFVHSKKGENKMVELKGTEKQVKLANEIRKNMEMAFTNDIAKYTKFMDKVEEVKKNEATELAREVIAEMKKNANEILSNEDSKFFIDYRTRYTCAYDLLVVSGKKERVLDLMVKLSKKM